MKANIKKKKDCQKKNGVKTKTDNSQKKNIQRINKNIKKIYNFISNQRKTK